MSFQELFIDKQIKSVIDFMSWNKNPQIKPDIVPMIAPFLDPGGNIKKEKRWQEADVRQIMLRPQFLLIEMLEDRPNLLLHAIEEFFKSLKPMDSSFAIEYELANINGRPTITQIATVRNDSDATLLSSQFEAQFRGEAIKLEDNDLYSDQFSSRIKYFDANETAKKDYVYKHFDLIFDYSISKVIPDQFITETNHLMQVLTEICPQLTDLDYVSFRLILFHSLPEYNKYLALHDQMEAAEEIAKLKYYTAGLVNPYYNQQNNKPIQRDGSLIMFALKIVAIIKREKEHEIMQQVFSVYKNYPLRPISIDDYKKKGIPIAKLIYADKLRASLITPQILMSKDIALLIPSFNTNILNNDGTYISSLRADKIPDKPIGKSNHIIAGVDPDTGKQLILSRDLLIPGFAAIGVPGSGKTTILLQVLYQILSDPTQAAIEIMSNHSPEEMLSCIPERQNENVIWFDSRSEHPIGINVLSDIDPDYYNSNFMLMLHAMCINNPEHAVAWGHLIDSYIKNGLRLLTSEPFKNATIEHLRALPKFLDRALKISSDSKAVSYFKNEYVDLKKKMRDPTTSVSTLLEPFCTKPISNITCQLKPKVDMAEAFKQGKILCLDLHRGALGLEKTYALASIFAMIAQSHILNPTRFNNPSELVWGMFDEAHLYLVDEIAELALSQGRNKGGRSLLTYQNRSQFRQKLRNSVEAMGLHAVFRCTAEEAEYWSKEARINARHILSLPPHHFYMRVYDKTYYLKGLAPLPKASPEIVQMIKQRSEEEYGSEPVEFNDSFYQSIFPKSERSKKDITA